MSPSRETALDRAMTRLVQDLAFAAPETWITHVRKRMYEAVANDRADLEDAILTLDVAANSRSTAVRRRVVELIHTLPISEGA